MKVRKTFGKLIAGLTGALALLALTAPLRFVGVLASTPPVTISVVNGTFYANPSNSGGFDSSQLSSPVFAQQFPLVGFNPPTSAQPCTNSTGVDVNTRPFTDVIPNPDGSCSTLVAQGNGQQAGSGTLFTFEAVFTGSLNVAAAGQVTFNVFSDDGFVLAIGPQGGNQPTQVSGPLLNAPAAGFVTGFPVLGAFNVATGPVGNTLTIDFPVAGSFPFEFDYTECCGGQLSLSLTAGGVIVPPPPPPSTHTTALTYTGDTSADFNDVAHLSATLTDTTASPAVAIPNETITLSLGTQSCTGITDATGAAACTVMPNLAAGNYTVMASFAGDSSFLASSASAPFTVSLEEDTLTYTGAVSIANGQPAILSATLLEDGATAISGRLVTFTLGAGASAQTCTGMTDSSGTASCTISSVSQPVGPGTVMASFTSDGFYVSALATANTLIFAAVVSGAFVLGDGNSAVGTSATFWGAQWSLSNSLSGGTAPASFKGFAETLAVSPAACGSHWSTDTGDSSMPPATVPAFIAVIVTSSVSQSGSVVSGNIVEIVVVRTNAGYLNDPGHPGTGTVVAVLCHS
jgi:hypothetical protein